MGQIAKRYFETEGLLKTRGPLTLWKKDKKRQTWHSMTDQVAKQAQRHSIRGAINDLIKVKRPLENEEHADFRSKNHRRLTYQGIAELSNLAVRILTEVNKQTPHEIWDNYNDTKPYNFLGQSMKQDEYLYRCIIPYQFKDPNAVTIKHPYNPIEPNIPPNRLVEDGGVDIYENINIEHRIITHDKIVWKFKDFFGYVGGKMSVGDTKYDFYYCCDDEDWYIYRPAQTDQNREIVYIAELWYNHNTGELPINWIPGVFAWTKDDIKYRETMILQYLEYADEFDSRFQDDQVVNARYAYPIQVMAPMKCPVCKGQGWSHATDNANSMRKTQVTCKDCMGTGLASVPTIFGRIVRPKVTGDTKLVEKAMEYIYPDVGILEHSFKNPFFLLDRGRKSIGLNNLEGSNESGEAKKIILENRQMILLNMTLAALEWKERDINFTLALLGGLDVDGQNQRIRIRKPTYIAVKSEDVLRKEIDEAPKHNRYHKTIEYYNEVYRNDPVRQKIHMLALDISKLSLLTDDEIRRREDIGNIDAFDYFVEDNAVYVITEMAELDSERFLELDNIQAINLAVDTITKMWEVKQQNTNNNAGDQVQQIRVLKERLDAIGVGIRAGVLTAQRDDEEIFREILAMPDMSQDVESAWEEDGGFRRPITLKGEEPSPQEGVTQ